MKQFTLIVEQGEDGYLIAEAVGLPGCRTQARSYDELLERAKEAIELYLEVNPIEIPTKFVGVQQIEIEAP